MNRLNDRPFQLAPSRATLTSRTSGPIFKSAKVNGVGDVRSQSGVTRSLELAWEDSGPLETGFLWLDASGALELLDTACENDESGVVGGGDMIVVALTLLRLTH